MPRKSTVITDRSGAIDSLRRAAKEGKPAPVIDDAHFVLAHIIERGLSGPVLIRDRRKAAYKSRRQEQQRQEAEAAAATVLRHRIADNERRFPAIFAQIRAPEFQSWYERATGMKWEARFEADMEEMRYRIIRAAGLPSFP